MRRTVAGGALLLAVTLVGCTTVGERALGPGLPDAVAAAPTAPPLPAPTTPSLAEHRDEVDALLADLATAFLTGDGDLLRSRLHDPDSEFGRRWTARLEHMREVPFTRYELRPDVTLADLTSASVPGDGGLLVNVLEDHDLAGFEALGPLREHLFLTLRQRDGGWTVAGDTDGERLGLVSVDHLWDQGPVVTTRRGDLLALHHPGQPGVDDVLAETERALATATAAWPLAWPQQVPLLIPADQDELAELLHVTFDLSSFIAFATTTPYGELGEVTMSGSRVMLNTPRFLSRSSDTRERILVHELIHAASRPSSSPDVPSWLEEGVAQALGEGRSTTGTRLLDALASSGTDVVLPLDTQFSTGGRDRIFLSYQQAWSFTDWLVGRYGRDAVGAFYLAGGAAAYSGPGTRMARLDAAAVAAFGAPLDELVSTWSDQL